MPGISTTAAAAAAMLLAYSIFETVSVSAETTLTADGITNPYSRINFIFGGSSSALELPDCGHPEFGPHITQQFDLALNTFVFAFHLHIKPDDDRCQKFDRQRNEIKTNPGANAGQLVGYSGEFVTLSWNFKLDAEFQASYGFCHIHQLKAVDGDDSMPIITLTPRKSNPNELQLLQYDSKGALHFLATTPLQPFLGNWVHAVANVTYGHSGKYDLKLTRISDSRELLRYSSANIDFWRNATTFVRPKWGIYRSLQEAVLSRDETVLFDSMCVGKGTTHVCV